MENDVRDVLTVNGAAPTFFDNITTNGETGDFVGAWVIVEMDPVASGTQYTVEFDTDGGSYIAPVTVNDGDTVGRPQDDPTKDNYSFAGWYANAQRTEEYDFGDPVHEPRIVYAKWEEVEEPSISLNYVSLDFGTFTIGSNEDLTRDVTVTNDSDNNLEVSIDMLFRDVVFWKLLKFLKIAI